MEHVVDLVKIIIIIYAAATFIGVIGFVWFLYVMMASDKSDD